MASTSGGIVAHVSSASATIESVSITEKIVEKSRIESIFVGSEHQSLIFLHNIYSLFALSLQIMCVFLLS